jgi:hypothetical protein
MYSFTVREKKNLRERIGGLNERESEYDGGRHSGLFLPKK